MAVPNYESKVTWLADNFNVEELVGMLNDEDFEALYRKIRALITDHDDDEDEGN